MSNGFIQDTGATGSLPGSMSTPSINVAAGHSLLIAVLSHVNTGDPNPMPTLAGNGNTYVNAGSITDTFGTFVTLFYVLAANPNATVVTVSQGTGNINGVYVAEYSGLAAFINSSLAFVNGASVGANTVASSTIPISGPSLLWGFCSELGTDVLTAGTSPNVFTARGAGAINAKTASEDASVAGTAAATFGCNTGSAQFLVGALAFTLAPAGPPLAGSASDTTSATGALTATPAPYAQILLNDPAHRGGSTQINMGTGPNTNTGDKAQIAFLKLIQSFTDLNTMLAQLFPARSIQAPLTGFAIAAAPGLTKLVLNPAGTLAAGAITMPPNPGDQQPFMVKTSQTINGFSATTSDGTTANGVPGTLAANTSIKWIFEAPLNTWFRE
jgi:hypothetical protein